MGSSSAEPPRKPDFSQFRTLVQRSPFTIRPASRAFAPTSSLEQEWMLGSIRPDGDSWRVTLINKKDREQRIRLIPGFPTEGFELLNVKQDLTEPMESEVEIRKGGQTGRIRYDQKLIQVKSSSGKKPSPMKPVSLDKRIAVPTSAQNSTSRSRRVIMPKK